MALRPVAPTVTAVLWLHWIKIQIWCCLKLKYILLLNQFGICICIFIWICICTGRWFRFGKLKYI